MPVTWYFWVWGALSCLALAVLFVAGLIAILYMKDMRRNGLVQELNHQIATLEKRLANREDYIKKQTRTIEELRKEQNEFGRISP